MGWVGMRLWALHFRVHRQVGAQLCQGHRSGAPHHSRRAGPAFCSSHHRGLGPCPLDVAFLSPGLGTSSGGSCGLVPSVGGTPLQP